MTILNTAFNYCTASLHPQHTNNRHMGKNSYARSSNHHNPVQI